MTMRMTEAAHEPVALARAAHEQARALLGRGASRREMLAHLARAGEQASGPGSVVSILVLDEAGLLRDGASPGLPADYLHAIDGLKPDPLVGTCAAAAATGRQVTTPDFRADHKWAELRHLPLALGFASAWSLPIKASDGRVLGTFGTYFRECREPTPQECEAVSVLARVAAEVLGT
jgi:GAF domain-containing protein